MIELKNVDGWRRSIGAIATFISEGNFRFNENGVHLRAIDSSQIVLVDFLMNKNSFSHYEIEPNFVGIDLVELNKIVARSLPGERLKMDLSDSEMHIQLVGGFEKSFKLPLIETSDDEISLPTHSYDCTIEINARIFKEALKDASIFGSAVVLKVKNKQFLIEAKGSHGNLSSVSKDSKLIKVIGQKDITAKFSLNFLQNIVKEANGEDKIKLELKSDSPMKISYKINNNEIRFFLAHMLL